MSRGHLESPEDVGAKCPNHSPRGSGLGGLDIPGGRPAWRFRTRFSGLQQLQCQEKVLERWLVVVECMLQGPEESLPSSQSGSLPATPQQARLVIRWQVKVEHPLAVGLRGGREW